MGAVTLLVADLDGMTAWYRDVVLLDVLPTEADATAVLGRGTTPILVLRHEPALTHAATGSAGLFHTAILFETQASLATSVYSIARAAPQAFTGSADHLVSQAFYFDDPEGNGIELYWDRDRSQWSWTHGRVQMASLQLDPNEFLRQHLTEDATAQTATSPATVGHVHLSIGDVPTARQFYVDQLGFETTSEFGSQALFVSAGRYHHHMAMNTWNSNGAGRRAPALGLGSVDILVPTSDDIGALAERLTSAGVARRDDGRVLSFDDPWGNLVRVSAS